MELRTPRIWIKTNEQENKTKHIFPPITGYSGSLRHNLYCIQKKNERHINPVRDTFSIGSHWPPKFFSWWPKIIAYATTQNSVSVLKVLNDFKVLILIEIIVFHFLTKLITVEFSFTPQNKTKQKTTNIYFQTKK